MRNQRRKNNTAFEQEKPLGKKEAKKQRKEDKKAAKKDKKAQKKAAKKEKKKEKWATLTFGQKLRKFFFKLLLETILFIALVCGIVGILMHFQILDFPAIDRFVSESKIINYAENVERKIPETNISDFTLYQSSETNIVTDVEQGVTFVNNEVLVTVDSSQNKQKLENYISRIGGRIVGEIPELADYQILFDKEYDIRELQTIITELSEQEWVVSADPNYCIKIDTQYIPNDKKWSKEWDDVPDGTNWGVEAIDIQEAWDYQSNMTTTVNIGVIDNMFDVNHEDLLFSEDPLGNVLATKGNEWNDHGTHTSGTIAATTNNKVGIAGISINDNLYGVSYVGLAVGKYDTLQSLKIALYYLIVTNNCAVINMSIGVDHLTFEASRCGVHATNELNNIASGIENLLQQLIDRDYQFVICKSAGNQNEVGGDYQYFRKDENDDDYPYEYYSYSDYLKYLNGEKGYECFAKYKDEKDAIENRLESGNVDAKYDFLGMISNQKVKNRIIVVGAAESLGTHKEGGFLWFGRKTVHNGYSIASFSQCGDRVDVLAPGVAIYSCVKNGYSSKEGTSMAAPHVSGVAALLFSVNPNLSADDVKRIICDTAVGSYGNENYGLLNAKNAVEAALNYIPVPDQAGETGEKEKPDLENMSVHDQYILAYENMTKSGSWSEKLSATVPMTVSGDGQSEQGTMKMQSNTNVKGWKEDDLSNLYLEGDGNISLEGSTAYAWTMNYKNGKLKYQYTAPYAMSAEKEMDPLLFNFGELPEKTMHNAQVKDDQITFTVPGGYMAEVGLNATQMLSELDDLDYGDATVTAAINKSDWTLKNVHMKFSATMTYMDYPVSADFDITYEFGPAGEFHETDTEEDSQESGSVNPTGHQYEVYENDSVTTWEEAKAFCENLGGHLAIISSQEENDYVYNLMKESGYDSAYFGLTDKEEEGKWICVDGTSAEYVNWNSEEPSNSYDGENYAMFYYKYTDGTWNDGDFDVETQNGGHAFICEWEKM